MECSCAGLNELDVEGEWLVLRQVLWKVPDSLLEKTLSVREGNPRTSAAQERKKRSWTLTDSSQHQRGEVSGRGSP